MNDNQNPRRGDSSSYQERRRRTDWVTHMATILSLVSWVIAIAVLLVLDMASPERNFKLFTTLAASTAVRNYWNTTFLPIAFGLLVASFIVCIIAFFFNMLRNRRKTDKYKKSIIIIGIGTVIGIVVFIIRFGKYLFW